MVEYTRGKQIFIRAWREAGISQAEGAWIRASPPGLVVAEARPAWVAYGHGVLLRGPRLHSIACLKHGPGPAVLALRHK